MTTQRSSLKTKRITGGVRTIGVEFQTYEVGRLMVSQVLHRMGSVVISFPLDAAWHYLWGASSSAPQLLKRVRIMADGAQTVRLAIMTTDSGTPTVANAFLCYNYPIGGTTIFSWFGNVVLKDRYLYGFSTGASTVASIYLEYELLTP